LRIKEETDSGLIEATVLLLQTVQPTVVDD